MGRQGTLWCGKNSSGILVLMAHQNYFGMKNGEIFYETPGVEISFSRVGSAKKSLDMIENYFQQNKEIILIIGVFNRDGGPLPNGEWESSKFKEATGYAYKAVMQNFDRKTGYLLCTECNKFELSPPVNYQTYP